MPLSVRPPSPSPPPWGGGTPLSSLIPRLSAGLARRARAWEQKGVSAGQPEIGSCWQRCWGFGHLRSQPGAAGPRRPSRGQPVPQGCGGALPVVPISGFSGALEPAGPLTRALLCWRAPGAGTRNVGTRREPGRFAGFAGCVPMPLADRRCRPSQGPYPLPARSPGTSWAGLAMERHVPPQRQQRLEPLAALASKFGCPVRLGISSFPRR